MPLILSNFVNKETISGIWEVEETTKQLYQSISLKPSDINLLESIKSEKRKIEIIAVRNLLKYLDINSEINYDINGKPLVKGGNISISHSYQYVGLIYSEKHICSIDIERISEKILKVKNKIFDNAEIDIAQNNHLVYTLMWSCKECVFKIADKNGIDFKKQIKVIDICDVTHKIVCKFIEEDKTTFYEMNYFIYNNFVFVYCVK